ncbi:MAG TPA: 16S rRNA (guanine(966)-N(2))-methyltransferase RsmD [Acidimicrobiales bacterium]|nr:16S rRNA (guanine(966)-N(2))-methyltransferase RsmD [Acidimicrobiales bacterium]
MRIIGGTHRGRRLVGPSSEGTRPLSDRAREALFNILGPGIRGERFLDLFAGTGAVGLEALSRGALSATFVEQGRAAVADIRANVDALGLADQASVVAGDALGFLGRTREQFDVVFAGPPQWNELWKTTLQAVDQRDEVLADGGLLVTQLDPSEDTGDGELEVLTRVDARTYGRTLLLFHERRT